MDGCTRITYQLHVEPDAQTARALNGLTCDWKTASIFHASVAKTAYLEIQFHLCMTALSVSFTIEVGGMFLGPCDGQT